MDPKETTSWRAARTRAEASGWNLAATGDWSWLYRSPDGGQAWRITPFDPAFRAFVDVCRASTNLHLPRILEVHDHTEAGYSVIMEWLEPVAKAEADRWFEEFEHAVEGELARARRLLIGAADRLDLPLFAGIDRNPTNVLRRGSDGARVFTDAFWIDGPQLFEMIETQPQQALRLFSADDLEQWAHLPCMDAHGTEIVLGAIGR